MGNLSSKAMAKSKTRKRSSSISAEERRWRAEGDAHTLMQAHAIRKDKSRYSAAKAKAREIIKERRAEVEGLQQLIKGADD